MIALVLAAALAGAQPAETAPPAPVEAELAGPLRGTVLQGDPKGPVAVILAGSGPTDRDGNSPLGIRGGAYRKLAEGLQAQGVTTVRVDKRGMFGSAAAAADPNAVTVEILAADANAWAAEMKRRTGAKCVWLIGHSEGGLVALIAAQTGKDLCGVILVSAPGRRLSDVIRGQLAANPGAAPYLEPVNAVIADLEAGRAPDISKLPAPFHPLFGPHLHAFLKVMFKYDPADLARAYKGPLLVVQGDNDLQISMADAERLAAAHAGAPLVRLPGVNHVLREAPTDRAGNFAVYASETAPLAPGVAGPIADFMKKNGPKK